MHEFSLANSIIGKLKPALHKALLEKKNILVRLSIGELVYSDNLKFWVVDMAKRDLGPTVRIKITVENSDIKCKKCGYSGKATPMGDHHMIVCPKCSSTNVTVNKGNKIFVVGVEVSRKSNEVFDKKVAPLRQVGHSKPRAKPLRANSRESA